jgi:hypothetical protein
VNEIGILQKSFLKFESSFHPPLKGGAECNILIEAAEERPRGTGLNELLELFQ